MKEKLKQDLAKEEAARQTKKKLPLLTTLLSGASLTIFYFWQNWNNRQCRVNFVFTETNFWNLGNYHSLLISPLSYENGFFFWANLPGLAYTSWLIEKHMGLRVLLGAYLFNACVSAATTCVWHRQIGFREVQKRGRVSNMNGNGTLFLTTLFTALAPHYQVFTGKRMATSIYFYYITGFYYLLFFTNHVTDPKMSQFKHALNHNETHFSAAASGILLGLLLRRLR